MDDIKAKQQVVEKIKEASKILVTVSNSPSVDALSAALGLTLLFEKQEKYATAIFSGEVPPAIAFLEPEKTFDETTDSLRDFIIALNKEKADHLRYKVEGDSVKIFITPYKTTISQQDLDFSQGDYNVELVIALGVDSQDHLDKALDDHGQILHDATVITVSAGDQSSNLGGIDWHDTNASSLSEMVTGLAEALKDDKKKSLLDKTISTALLTGIVAQTERFSNEHTTSKAMTVAAQLMSAGADQQLIATELQTSAAVEEVANEAPESTDQTDDSSDSDENAEDEIPSDTPVDKDVLSIQHDTDTAETLAELDERVRTQEQEESAEESVEPEQPAEEEPASVPEPVEEPEAPVAPDVKPNAPPETITETPKPEGVSNIYSTNEDDSVPALGGTLNATSEQAAEDARREAMSGQNKTILSHAYIGDKSQISTTMGATPIGFPGTPDVAPGSVGINEVPQDEVHAAYSVTETTDQSQTSAANSAPTFGIGGDRVIAPLETPLETPTAAPAAPLDFGLPLPPPLPDFSQAPATPPSFPPLSAPTLPPVAPFQVTPEPTTQPEILGDILAPEPTAAYSFEAPSAPIQPPTDNPGQFKIPS
jgi:hypothetical protein